MSGSAGQVVLVFLLHVDCSGAAGVGGGGDGVSPGRVMEVRGVRATPRSVKVVRER